MIIRIEPNSPIPPYEQIRSQIARMVVTGVLPAGTRLPAIRQLSKDLALAGGTVARAYRELESDGVIETRGRHGTFVAATTNRPRPDASEDKLAEAAMAFAVHAQQLGADPARALSVAQEALNSTQPHFEQFL